MTTWTTAADIPAAGVLLEADVIVPAHATGVVVFAHGRGSSRQSPRNRAVADALNEHHLATVLANLLTAEEDRADRASGHAGLDIGVLADRLVGIVDWLGRREETRGLPVGLFGGGTGAAAALVVAAAKPEAVRAVVCRGGRPDLAGPALIQVCAPTLFLVGEHDMAGRDLNQQARNTMTTLAEVRIIPEATHLFGEPGALLQVANESVDWFHDHLTHAPAAQHHMIAEPSGGTAET